MKGEEGIITTLARPQPVFAVEGGNFSKSKKILISLFAIYGWQTILRAGQLYSWNRTRVNKDCREL